MNWKSFIKPTVLYHTTTVRGVRLEVRERNGARELYLDGYPQTQRQYRHDWAKLLKNLPAQKVLLLGLGGGDVVKILTSQHTNKLITAVELEPEVIAVAREYFGIAPSEKLVILAEDAKLFMARNARQYDLVVVDLYSGDGVPEFVENEQFLREIARALAPRGVAIINYASHSFGKSEFEKFENKLKKVFAHVTKRVIWGHTFYQVTN